ncbi:GlsB/YeaQ/YmgE family stress response membrane protein [Sphingomonas bacterium]|uniref:GlsB/YeaQ/YmgE family stress response membrane protein n=1 Tax=Sphingomonas bacterium TaxID=1895847 RepID=UPI002630EC13|nr:GlsB/YeaQ/YmgE family stress response membrane protein [Sphingomonas bacterium]MDB5677649.1 transglycosylase [Sphingomonas bacterium]
MPERSILAWLAIGLVVGVIGKFVMPGKDPGGGVGTILIGIAGALIGGFVAETMHRAISGTWQNYAASIVGAVVVLAIYRVVRHRRPG